MLKKTEIQIQKIKDRVEAAHMLQTSGMDKEAEKVLQDLAYDILDATGYKEAPPITDGNTAIGMNSVGTTSGPFGRGEAP